MSDFIVIDSTEKVLSLIVVLIAVIGGGYVIFLYYFNKYYTNKYKNDFFYLFWGYEDKEDKISANKHLSLFIYHFISFYMLSSYKWVDKRYKIFPEDIKDMDPNSFMPNATKGNLENFEKKHMKWLKFNIISQRVFIFLGFCLVALYLVIEYLAK